jgi:hypothetical protein
MSRTCDPTGPFDIFRATTCPEYRANGAEQDKPGFWGSKRPPPSGKASSDVGGGAPILNGRVRRREEAVWSPPRIGF